MNLTLVIYSLTAGGAERVMSIMATWFAVQRGWNVTVITLTGPEQPPFYPLPPEGPGFRVWRLGVARPSSNPLEAVANNVDRVRTLHQKLVESAPQVIIAYTNVVNILTLLATRTWPRGHVRPAVLVAEHIFPSQMIGRFWEQLRLRTYPLADAVVLLNRDSLDYVFKTFPPSIRQVALDIPNPVIEPVIAAPTSDGPVASAQPPGGQVHPAEAGDVVRTPAPTSTRTVIAMGRLDPQKGFDLLLQAFQRVAAGQPDWSLVIWGEGPQRGELEQLRDALGLSDRVRLPGLTRDSYGEMRKADLFVMSSRFEGFPMVLCEAMACGLPVISFDCTSGPRDIIREGIDGVLVREQESVPALAAAMDRLMADAAARARLAARAPDIIKRFSLPRVMSLWEQVIHNLVVRRDSPLRDVKFVDTVGDWPTGMSEVR